MSSLSGARLARYAREQIRAADVILAYHGPNGPLCSCGRVLPCSAAFAVTRRRSHFLCVLAKRRAPYDTERDGAD
ncbi:MAG: hypothetical protein ACRDT6_24340 [Micromonosporaceae bacterium]